MAEKSRKPIYKTLQTRINTMFLQVWGVLCLAVFFTAGSACLIALR